MKLSLPTAYAADGYVDTTTPGEQSLEYIITNENPTSRVYTAKTTSEYKLVLPEESYSDFRSLGNMSCSIGVKDFSGSNNIGSASFSLRTPETDTGGDHADGTEAEEVRVYLSVSHGPKASRSAVSRALHATAAAITGANKGDQITDDSYAPLHDAIFLRQLEH